MLKIKKKKYYEYVMYILIIAAGIIFDQVTKIIAHNALSPNGSFPLIEGVFHFTYYTNPGMAFGLLPNARWIFMSASVIMILALSAYLFLGLAQNRLYEVSVSMIISGGIGNMIDRIFLGEVIDFLDFRLINFAVFNVADSIVCVGAGLLILALVLDIVKEAKEEKKKRSGDGE